MRINSLAQENRVKFQQLLGSRIDVAGFTIKERTRWERFIKRFIDVLFSLSVVLLGFPFFLAVILLIKLTSKGSIFFTQERIGENGRSFNLYKFRTMRPGTDDSLHKEFTRNFIKGQVSESALDVKDASVYKLKDDPRITSVGNFLRRTSLDELPQFINILKGEMTIVGPRPPLLYEYDHYEEWHKLRLRVRPGLTGLWQVSGRSRVPFNEMVKMDIHYIQTWSLAMDFRIMIQTIPVMLVGTGGF